MTEFLVTQVWNFVGALHGGEHAKCPTQKSRFILDTHRNGYLKQQAEIENKNEKKEGDSHSTRGAFCIPPQLKSHIVYIERLKNVATQKAHLAMPLCTLEHSDISTDAGFTVANRLIYCDVNCRSRRLSLSPVC